MKKLIVLAVLIGLLMGCAGSMGNIVVVDPNASAVIQGMAARRIGAAICKDVATQTSIKEGLEALRALAKDDPNEFLNTAIPAAVDSLAKRYGADPMMAADLADLSGLIKFKGIQIPNTKKVTVLLTVLDKFEAGCWMAKK